MKLFRSVSQVFVTREQLGNLGIEMYSTLNIIEDYELSEYKFNEEFIKGLIKLSNLN